MKTNEFLEIIRPFIVKKHEMFFPVELLKITADSRDVCEGTVFFCIKGQKTDGHKFAGNAALQGASIIIGEDVLDIDRYIQVSSVKDILKAVSPVFYGHLDSKMKMIAVTGTNGKTSTTYIIDNILRSKFNCGVIGTLGYRYGKKNIEAANTTPLNWKWYSLLNEMLQEGVDVVISEVSSHSIEEERIEKTLFDAAVFTNLTIDHLDFHKNLENYFNAKKKLFTNHLKKDGTAIINIDDEYGKRLFDELPEEVKKIRISVTDKNAELYLKIEKADISGSTVSFNFYGVTKKIHIPLVGKFNVYNAAGAFAVSCIFAGIDHCVNEIEKSVAVPGRLEKVGKNPVYIDYAHTPDALENVLSTIRDLIHDGRIITVFGAGGDRDKGKRPIMGEVVSRLSDMIIITDDNPRTEDPDVIISEILSGCNSGNKVIEVIHDRRSAIRRAIDLNNGRDVILIAGKGAENYQITKNGKKIFSDKEEVEKYLEELQHVHNNLS